MRQFGDRAKWNLRVCCVIGVVYAFMLALAITLGGCAPNLSQSLVANAAPRGTGVHYDNDVSDILEGAMQGQNNSGLRSDREIVCWGDSLTWGLVAEEGSFGEEYYYYDSDYNWYAEDNGSSKAADNGNGEGEPAEAESSASAEAAADTGESAPAATVEASAQSESSGQSYPEVLAQLTGLTVYNFGVNGATSEELVYMQADVRPEGYDAVFNNIDYEVKKQGKLHPGDVLVLEMGSNGGWYGDYNVLISQYRTMIDASGCTDYLIIGDTDDPGTSEADYMQSSFEYGEGTGETSWEAALREEFGDHFINMRAYLVENGLQAAGLEPTDADREAAMTGCVSTQLRSDGTHLNASGYYAMAMAIYERGLGFGYW